MSKIRAYKLAEELGLERDEFVEKAAELGFELKSAMAALEPELADQLRQKMGGAKQPKGAVIEERVERGGATTVIRRRKRVEPPPEPVEVPTAPEPAAAEPAPAAQAPVVEEVTAEPSETPAELDAQPTAVAAAPAPKDSPPRAEAPVDRKGKQRKRVREVVNLREQEQFARQVTGRTGPRRTAVLDTRSMVNPRRRRRDAPAKKTAPRIVTEQKPVIRIEGEISVGELARAMGMKAAQVQGKLMALGTMVSVNQTVDLETTRKLVGDMGFEVLDVGFKEEEFLDAQATEEGAAGNEQPRPPVITVMGHVDHGKTSLLDAIRKTDVVAGEAGGITQHIGAYQAIAGDATLTFIDTPGHAAFTSMRARGAQVTDIVILVVAASDGVMPQTIEAIEHAKSAGVPIVVAVNKIDLPGADPKLTRQRLMEHELVSEEFGGDVICVDVSATKGTGLGKLLEMVSLQAELLELKADPSRRAKGMVLEAQLDKGRGPVATVLIQDGTLRLGDIIVAGTNWGRLRLMENDAGELVKEAGPSVPVQLVGLSGVPEAGTPLHAVESERVAKQIVDHREDRERGRPVATRPKLSLDEFFAQQEGGGPKELGVVLKTDVHGSVEALKDALEKLSTDSVKLNVISAGVGAITESDIMLARASNAIVLGFHVRPDPAARREAENQGVDVRVYKVIYDVLDEVKAAMVGLLPPTEEENMLGRAEVRETFTIPKLGTIAGSYVTEGLVRRNALCRLVRDGVQIYEGRVGSLKRFKDDAREVQNGFECGIGIDGYNDVKVGDAIEVYEIQEKPATL
ncbi:MAG: translation initiation factor IF-2 [Proteobacteria bacterium]|nr:translation initiation factor IF-2 [Pseudomonadota bacterium]